MRGHRAAEQHEQEEEKVHPLVDSRVQVVIRVLQILLQPSHTVSAGRGRQIGSKARGYRAEREEKKKQRSATGREETRPYLLRILFCRIRDRDELRNQLALRRRGRHPRNLAGRPPAEFVSPKMHAGKAPSRKADTRQSTRPGRFVFSSPTRPQPWV